MDCRLAESFVNRDDHIVLGRRLHDFCLSDVLFLSIDDNPIWVRGKAATLDDLRSAVVICSTPPAKLRRARFPRLSRWWMWQTRKVKFADELHRFADYVEDFDQRPKFWSDEGEREGLRAPWVLSTLVFLEDHTNMSEDQILTAPLGWTLWKAAALAEQLGLSRDEIMTEEEEKAMEEMGVKV